MIGSVGAALEIAAEGDVMDIMIGLCVSATVGELDGAVVCASASLLGLSLLLLLVLVAPSVEVEVVHSISLEL